VAIERVGAAAAAEGGAVRHRTPSPVRMKRLNSTVLLERVTELERSMKQEDRTKKREEKQRAKDMSEARKRISKEMTTVSRLVRSTSVEVAKLEGQISRADKQKEQLSQRKIRQDNSMQMNFKKVEDKHAKLETSLLEKTEKMGEAKGRLAHVEFVAKMLELGIVIPAGEGMAALPAPDGPKAIAAGDGPGAAGAASSSSAALGGGAGGGEPRSVSAAAAVAAAAAAASSAGPEGADKEALRRMLDTLLQENWELAGRNRELMNQLQMMAQGDGKLLNTSGEAGESTSAITDLKDMEEVSTNATMGNLKSMPPSPYLDSKLTRKEEHKVIYPCPFKTSSASSTEAPGVSTSRLSAPVSDKASLCSPQPRRIAASPSMESRQAPQVDKASERSPRLMSVSSVAAVPTMPALLVPQSMAAGAMGRSSSAESHRGRFVGLSPERVVRVPAGAMLQAPPTTVAPTITPATTISPISPAATISPAAAFMQPSAPRQVASYDPIPLRPPVVSHQPGTTFLDRSSGLMASAKRLPVAEVQSLTAASAVDVQAAGGGAPPSTQSTPSVVLREPLVGANGSFIVRPPSGSTATTAAGSVLSAAGTSADRPWSAVVRSVSPTVRSASPTTVAPSAAATTATQSPPSGSRTNRRLSLDAVVRKLTASALREYAERHFDDKPVPP